MKKKLIIILIPFIAYGVWFGISKATSNPHTWTNGLVGYWNFDGQNTTTTSGAGAGTRDASNNGNWGTFSGGVKPVGGVVGQALSFDGVDDYVDAGSSNTFNFTSGDFSIELWAKLNNLDTNNLISRGNYETDGWYFQYQSGVGLRLFTNQSGAHQISSTGPISINTWYHIAVRRSGSGIRIYLNGVDSTVELGTHTDPTSANRNLNIGAYVANPTSDPTDGLIDEVRIYNRALSADEVKQHYEQTRRNVVLNNPSGTPPVGWWKMDEGTGTQVKDYSNNANNGTPTGTTSVDGQIGKALSFNGSSDFVNAGSGASLNITTAGSWGGWLKLAGGAGTYRGVLSKGTSGTDANNNYELWVNTANNIIAYIGNGVTSQSITATTQPAIGNWYHVIVTADGSNLKIYVNGTLEKTENQTITPVAVVQELDIGRVATNYFNGLLDDVRIYNYARTADQIAADYRAGAYRTTVATSVPTNWWTNGLVGYWNFDGQNTTTTSGANAGTKDASGNNNWGTFIGGVKPVGGVVGQALSFDGVDDYVNVGSGASLNNITSEITIEAWIKPNTLDPVLNIFDKRGGGTISLYKPIGVNFRLYINDGIAVLANTQPVVNEWTHLVVTAKSGSIDNHMYFNGVDVSTSQAARTLVATTDVGYIGCFNASSEWFSGPLDEVRIYNRALSADEVLQHYQQTRRNLNF